MTHDVTLPALIAALFATAAAAPLLVRLAGRNAGYIYAAGYLAALAHLARVAAPAIAAGHPLTYSADWLPTVGVTFTLTVDALSLTFAGLVLGIGAAVMAYTARYVAQGGARLYGLLTAFAAAMLGIVTAADLVVLFIFWEATSVISFLLIGQDGSGAKNATRAFLTTAAGGLALLAAVALAGSHVGSFHLADVLKSDLAGAGTTGIAVALLIFLAAATKAAQAPFTFWLPGAMVAPTPVSTYLHAATMVKAGIYLIARMSPLYAGTQPWTALLIGAGLTTMIAGGVAALRAHDLKALLAGSTISQLGFLVATFGIGTPAAIAAGLLHTCAHASFKAALFMTVGIVDHATGTRDIRKLSGLRRPMPAVAAVAAVAGISMAGLPPLVGFVSKEEALAAFATTGSSLLIVAVTAASAVTFAYTARFLAIFVGRPGDADVHHRPGVAFVAPAAVVAVVGLVAGPYAGRLDTAVDKVVAVATGSYGYHAHLGLWHGFNAALVMSAVAVTCGIGLVVARHHIDRLSERSVRLDGAGIFDRVHAGVIRYGAATGRPFNVDTPTGHLAWLGAAVGVGLIAAVAAGRIHVTTPGASSTVEWALVGFVAVALAVVVHTASRMGAALTVGLVGLAVTMLYVLRGAPDLALTQLLVEALTVVLLVLALRRLPDRSAPKVTRRRAAAAGVAAAAVGAAATVATLHASRPRPLTDVAAYYLKAAPEKVGGNNVVNTILVDFRALDTLGEVFVLAVAAIGVFVLVSRTGADR